jgi:hypothetical protein
MATARRIPLPLAIVVVLAIGAIVVLNREAPLRRVAGALATTTLKAPIGGFSEAWSLSRRVLAEKTSDFTLRTVVAAVPGDRGAPPTSIYLAFRSVDNDEDFSIRIDNDDLELVVSATFPTPPQIRNLAPPQPIDPAGVRITLRRALSIADSALAVWNSGVFLDATDDTVVGTAAGDSDDRSGFGISTDVVLRTRGGTPEWGVSYLRDSDSGPEVLVKVIVNAADGSLRRGDGS